MLAALASITLTRSYWSIAFVTRVTLPTQHRTGVRARDGAKHPRGQVANPQRAARPAADAVAIITSAVLPCAILATASLHWTDPRNVQLFAEVVILIRIAMIVFIVERLHGYKPTGATGTGSFTIAGVMAILVGVKVLLTH